MATNKTKTVRQFCATEISHLDDHTVVRAIQFLASRPICYKLLSHTYDYSLYPEFTPPENLVYAKCKAYIRSQLRTQANNKSLVLPFTCRDVLTNTTLKSVEKITGIEFSLNFVEAFNALKHLEEIVDQQDLAFADELQAADAEKNRRLDMPMPW